jgi:DNA-binding response OmpR family regulator
MAEPRLNLTKAGVLLLNGVQLELDILGQVFMGFGVNSIRKCLEIGEADLALNQHVFDLVVVDSGLPDDGSFQFVSRIRENELGGNRFVPILLICGHTSSATIAKARDSGANFVVAKPITPKVLFDRIVWLAREERKFVECDSYAGPDRRHRSFGPPAGEKGRRKDDLSVNLGRADGPDMSQSEIDALLNPKRAPL